MRHLDTATATQIKAAPLAADYTKKLDLAEKKAPWPGPTIEEWRRTEFPPSESLPEENGTAGISWEIAPEDRNKLSVERGFDSIGLNMLSNDMSEAHTSLEYRHRKAIINSSANSTVTIRIHKNELLEHPITLKINYDEARRTYNTHVFIIAEENSNAEIIEYHEGSGSGMFISAGAHVSAENNTQCTHTLLQTLPEDTVFVYQSYERIKRDAQYRSFEGQFGGRTVKSRMTVECTEEGADASLNGIYISKGNQHKNVKPVQLHNSPKCASRSFYKGAVKEDATSVFQGIIKVAEGAEETDAYLTNKNLILNDGARADSIPNLEILNNNVKCSHGSTTGSLNEDELFYLQSRGIDREEGRRILIESYFEDVLKTISEEAKTTIRKAIAQFIKNCESL